MIRRYLDCSDKIWEREFRDFKQYELSPNSGIFQKLMYQTYQFSARLDGSKVEGEGSSNYGKNMRRSKYAELVKLNPKVGGKPVCFKFASGAGCEDAGEDGMCPKDPARIHSTKVSKHVMDLLRSTFKHGENH